MYKALTNKKTELDKYRPLPIELVSNLEPWFTVELTYSSNAIEGNTLTRQETALVVEKGLTVRGKSLSEHLEAHNHAKALNFIKSLVNKPSNEVTESDILEIHRLILQSIDDNNAGRYRNMPVRISGSMVVLPNHAKVPKLMSEFVSKIIQNVFLHPVELATQVHYELVSIHPFIDGNGRTARLLMNLILMQNGFPPAIISKRQRETYITSLEQAQLGGSRKDFDKLIAIAVEKSLDIYLTAAKGKNPPKPVNKYNLLKIGELAKLTSQSVTTIRYWTNKGLLKIASKTDKGYYLYDKSQTEQVKKILELKAERYSLDDINLKINR